MIHYHGTPCSGTKNEAARFLSVRHALISFAAPEDIGIAAEVCQSFVLDNGAFSSWKKGEPVAEWSGYYEFVDEWRRHPGFDWAIIPDVIDGGEDDNDALVDQWPFDIQGVPVWHMHESFERLERLLAWPRIAIGSSGEWPNPGTLRWWERIDEAMQVICDEHGRPATKLPYRFRTDSSQESSLLAIFSESAEQRGIPYRIGAVGAS